MNERDLRRLIASVRVLLKAPAMLVLLAFSIFVLLFLSHHLPAFRAELTLPFHQACLEAAPVSKYRAIYQALVCGSSISHAPQYLVLKQNFAATGLLHLLVVSGSHLIFLEVALRLSTRVGNLPNRFRNHAITIGLIGFTLINSAQPPVLRSLTSILLTKIGRHFNLNWQNSQILLCAGIVTLSFCADSAERFSLILSWTASLALHAAVCVEYRFRFKPMLSLLKNFAVYVAVFPALLPLSAPSPASVLCNWLYAPLMGAVLFPSALLAFAIPKATVFTDQIWILSNKLVEIAASSLPSGFAPVDISEQVMWIYLATISGAHWALTRSKVRVN